MNKLKLRIVIVTLEIGGAEVHLSQVLPALAEKGWSIELIILTQKLTLINKFNHKNIKIHYPSPKNYKNIPKNIKKILKLAEIFCFLCKILWKDSNIITHFFLPEAYIFGMFAAKLTRYHGPLLMSRRSLNNYQRKYPFIGKIEREFHKHCHLILSNSKAIQHQLITEENVPLKKTALIYNGVDEKRFTVRDKISLRKKLGYLNDQFIIICVANFIPHKGHMDLINGLSQIKDKLPVDWKTLLVGKERKNGYTQSLKEIIKQTNLSKNVFFIEDCDESSPFLLASDLGILPSHHEGFSNAIIEMLAAGLPVIATHVGGNPEAVIHEKNGLLIRPHCPDDIAHSILHFAKDENLRKKYGEHNYQVFLNNYTLNTCVEEYEKVYKSCYNVKN